MDSGEFFLLLYKNMGVYIFALVLCALIYFLFYRKYFISIWDPIFVSLVFSVLACTTPVFLFIEGEISMYYFAIFLATQIAFLIGLVSCKPFKVNVKIHKRVRIEAENIAFKIFFILVFIIHFTLQLLIYKYNGIPIFMYSKLEIYEAGGQLQFANRITTVLFPFLCFCSLYYLLIKKGLFFQGFTLIAILWILISGILSASRSFFLILGESVFMLLIFYDTLEIDFSFLKFKKLEKRMIFIGIFFALLVIAIQFSGGVNPVYILGYRLAASGDAYYMSFPNGAIEHVDKGHGLMSIFSSPLNMIGLANRKDIPESIGFQLVQYFNPNAKLFGPNARHNLIGYIYLGPYGAVIFSFMLGFLISFIRNKLYYLCNKNKISVLIFFGCLTFASKVETDYFLAQAYLINLLIFVMPLIVFSFFLTAVLKHQFMTVHSSKNELLGA